MLYRFLFKKLGYKLGFSIGVDTLGYGVVLHHHGTVIIGTNNKIGNYANILPSCISKSGSKFGDFFFIGYGAIITQYVEIGNNVKVAANSVVNSSSEDNVVLAGSPARVKKRDGSVWMEMYTGLDGEWMKRYKRVEELKEHMKL